MKCNIRRKNDLGELMYQCEVVFLFYFGRLRLDVWEKNLVMLYQFSVPEEL